MPLSDDEIRRAALGGKRPAKLDAEGKPIKNYIPPEDVVSGAIRMAPTPVQGAFGAAGMAAQFASEHSPEWAKKAAGGTIGAISDAIDYIEGGLAGGMVYAKKNRDLTKKEAWSPGGLAGAMKAGAERKASYQEALGPVGVFFDIVGPANALLPWDEAASILKAVSKPVAKGAAAGFNKAAEWSQILSTVKDSGKVVRSAFSKNYAYNEAGVPGLLDIESEYAGKMHKVRLMKPSDIEKEIKRLVPSEDRQKRLGLLTEKPLDEPALVTSPEADEIMRRVEKMKDGPERDALFERALELDSKHMDEQRAVHSAAVESYNKLIAEGITENEQKALELSRQLRDTIAARRKEGNVLTEERAAGLEAKAQSEYFPHISKPWQEQVKHLDEVIADKAARGEDATSLMELRASIKNQNRSRTAKLADRVLGRTNPFKAQGFTKERHSNKPIRDMGDVKDILNYEAASALGLARQQTEAAIAGREYIMDANDYLKSIGAAFTEDQAKTMEHMKELPSVYGTPKGVYVHESVYDKVVGMQKRMANTDESVMTFLPVLDYMTRHFRNWTLFTDPSTAMINLGGNVHNNYVTHGMGMDSIQDYIKAGEFLTRKLTGKMTEADKAFDDFVTSKRIIGTGWSSEPGYTHVNDVRTTAQKIRGVAGAESPILKPLQKGFTAVEDWSRLAAYLYQTRKGAQVRVAAKGTFKSLFDYELGLTDFERNVMRRAFPFYAWPRFNFPLQYQMILSNPSRYITLARMARGVEKLAGGPQPNEGTWPEYIQDQTPLRIGYDKQRDTYKVLPTENVVPSAQALGLIGGSKGETLRNFLKMVETSGNPIVGIPTQLAMNRDFLRSTPGKAASIYDVDPTTGKTASTVENIAGKNIRKDWAFAAKSFRPIRIADQVYDAINRPKDGKKPTKAEAASDIVERRVFGFLPEIDQKKTSEIYFAKSGFAINELKKKMRSEYNKSVDPSYSPGDRSAAARNVEVIGGEIIRLEQERQRQSIMEAIRASGRSKDASKK